MNEEADFLRAIQAAPGEDAPRLLYAHWLQYRDDPRAAYLLAEMEWAQYQSARSAAQATMKALSLRAQSLDPVWLSLVSRIRVELKRAWSAVASLPEVCRNGPAPEQPVQEWVSALAALREVVSRHLGSEFVEQRLCVPVDYITFLCADGGKWLWDEWGDIYAARSIAPTVDDVWNTFADQGVSSQDAGLWLHVADWHDRDGYYLCADAGHPLWGIVAVGEDSDPLDGVESLCFVAPTFLDFLRDALPAIVAGFPSWSADFTVADWLREGQNRSG